MKTIGLVGGMSWEATAVYYRLLNHAVKQRLGGFHAAQLLMYSIDFADFEILIRHGEWDQALEFLTAAAQKLEQGGADFFAICANTPHFAADELERRIGIPLLHIADPTGAAMRAAGLRRVALLGTIFTMEKDFYRVRLAQKFGLEVLIPNAEERRAMHRVIFEELVQGQVREESRAQYREIIDRLVGEGAEGIILGCTELMLLVKPEDSPVPLFDTTTLHAEAIAESALEGSAASAAQ